MPGSVARPSVLLATSTTGLPQRRSQPAKWRSASVTPGARVDDQERHIGVGERPLGLRLHAPGERGRRRLFEPGGVDHAEFEIGDAGLALAAVAGQPGRVVDQRQPAADQPVEQRRLADIGAAEDGDRKAHREALPQL